MILALLVGFAYVNVLPLLHTPRLISHHSGLLCGFRVRLAAFQRRGRKLTARGGTITLAPGRMAMDPRRGGQNIDACGNTGALVWTLQFDFLQCPRFRNTCVDFVTAVRERAAHGGGVSESGRHRQQVNDYLRGLYPWESERWSHFVRYHSCLTLCFEFVQMMHRAVQHPCA